MTTNDTQNPMLQLAHDFVFHTNQSVFVTGKAGTGKTTFLKNLRADCPKQMAVLAPTGVAAINAGGTTIHSFFQLPFTPFVPGDGAAVGDEAANKHTLISRLKFNREKRELLQSLDLLVIDEISMVRCDVLDAIDTLLRYFRNNAAPFGGVQMLFIGDMYQLPPVVKEEVWEVLNNYYSGPFFFDSQVIRQNPPVYVELQTIYRQSDERFIGLLNEVRNSKLTQDGLTLLNSRFNPDFKVPEGSHYITLTTHNKKADAINEVALQKLLQKPMAYKAAIEGDFNENSFPAEETLLLKVGAQVMFLKNDVQGKRYYNGKIGVVVALDEEEIKVQCEGDSEPISVQQDVWRNVQYSLNRQLQQVEEKELGAFTQFPLRLAWAVTIHKSQGLTFEHAIIDAASSFSAGQVYVALSRCKSLEGMVLLSKVPQSAVMVDKRVQQFAAGSKREEELRDFFAESRKQFQQQLLLQAFDGARLMNATKRLLPILEEHQESFGDKALPWAQTFVQQVAALKDTADKFQRQLQDPSAQMGELPEENEWLQERVKKAANWFATQLDDNIVTAIRNQPAVSDSKEHAAVYEEALAKCFTAAKQWGQLVSACRNGFNAIGLLQARSKVNISEVVGLAYAGSSKHRKLEDSPHPILLSQLKRLREAICATSNKPIYLVAGTATLQEMVLYLPHTADELLMINGFGEQKVKQYGDAFLKIITAYAAEHGLESNMADKVPKRKKKKATADPVLPKEEKISSHQVSYDMYTQGQTLEEIATTRQLKTATIESHLIPFVLEGKLPMSTLLSEAVYEKASAILLELKTDRMGPVKEIMGDEISFSQIRLVIEWLKLNGDLDLLETAASGDAKP